MDSKFHGQEQESFVAVTKGVELTNNSFSTQVFFHLNTSPKELFKNMFIMKL